MGINLMLFYSFGVEFICFFSDLVPDLNTVGDAAGALPAGDTNVI